MTPEQFVYWLRGYLAAQAPAAGRGQFDRIAETLNAVLASIETSRQQIPDRPWVQPPLFSPVFLPDPIPVPPFTVTCGGTDAR